MENAAFNQQLATWRSQTEAALEKLVPAASTPPTRLHTAMRYSLQAGGKRLRPILVLAGHALFGGDVDPMPAAVAIECLHTYSLIHDDLPAIDNSDLRRGKPTCHKAFDEATALLAGDALLTHAFYLLSTHYPAPLAQALVADLALAASSQYLIGGQMEDILAETTPPAAGITIAQRLDFIHQGKTAALIASSLRMGLRLSNVSEEAIAKATKLGTALGLAFQIVDDVLDATGTHDTLGKTAGADAARGKLTYPAVYGLEGAKASAHHLTAEALATCQELGGQNAFMLKLIQDLEHRLH